MLHGEALPFPAGFAFFTMVLRPLDFKAEKIALFQFHKEKSMYSPKIREDLIPRIYRAAEEAKLPMTAWVNQAVEEALPNVANEQPQPDNQRKDGYSHEYSRD